MRSKDIITGQYVAIEHYPASAADRLLARMIDYFAIIMYESAMLTILSTLFYSINDDAYAIITILLFAIPLAAYFPLCEIFFRGKTLGKHIQRIRVVQADGSRLRLTSALLRWVLELFDILFAFGLPAIIISRNSQRLGDIAADTIVIKETERYYDNNTPTSYDFAANNYHPTYPEASELSMKQYEVIERVLYYDNDPAKQQYLLNSLGNKVASTLDIMPRPGMPANVFLMTVLSDYRYYSSLPDFD